MLNILHTAVHIRHTWPTVTSDKRMLKGSGELGAAFMLNKKNSKELLNVSKVTSGFTEFSFTSSELNQLMSSACELSHSYIIGPEREMERVMASHEQQEVST